MILNGNVTSVCISGVSEMTDSKSKSVSEALTNTFGGYPLGYGISIIVLPLSVDWIKDDPLVASLFIGIVFATASFLRVYYLRRLFERFGYDDNFLKLAGVGIKKLYSFIRTKNII